MQKELTSTCGNCAERNIPCDGTQPICDACIRDGRFCSGFEALDFVPRSSPTLHTANLGTKISKLDPLTGAVSVIVSTPPWGSQAPARHTQYFSCPNLKQASQNQLQVLPTHSMIPKSIPPDPCILSNALPFISFQYARMIKRMAFGVPPPTIMTTLMERLSISSTTFSSMTLGAEIIRAMIDATNETNWMGYAKPIDTLHWQACNTPEEGWGLACAKGRLTVAIELTAYKFFISNNTSGYAFLRRLVPLVTRVAYNYPQIWTKQGRVSVQKILQLGVIELCSFLWMDTMTSTLLGTTPFLCYDTSTHEKLHSRYPLDWMNGCPQEFIGWFAKINTIRSTTTGRRSDSTLINWETVEKEIYGWKPIIDRADISRDSVTRLAVVEGWRNALLIYLYVGVCGLTSADRRVQIAVKQIIRLSQIVKHRATYERHLFGPAILAGACARLESHRRSILHVLAFQRRDRMWVLQISDFVFVLRHLWLGSAKDGGSITWDDYIRSRKAVLYVN
ncbi:unnamed protein product [Rhizoctonia solani]|uniref:Zn(2)-C6 fungal-type domain-containing protein n=1 Tax=Rhizoctonia solani TaxID=456999 RepID=A0A8H3GKW7_9AGAM|nr:unnamed protein product [Rhizoctonia solani]